MSHPIPTPEYLHMVLRSRIIALNLNQTKLSELSKIPQGTLSKIERGKMSLSIEHAFKLLNALDLQMTISEK